MSLITSILEKIDLYVDDDMSSFFIMEPQDYPFFLQFAKVGENFLLDIPTSNFFDSSMLLELREIMKSRYRKEIVANQENEDTPVTSYQIRFKAAEVNKMCYIAKEIFISIFQMEESNELNITIR